MEQPSVSKYQEALRDLLLCMMHQSGLQRTKRHSRDCRVVWSLPQLIDIVTGIPSDPPAAQHEAIRTRICSQCECQDTHGYCPLRVSGECCVSREEGRVIAVIRGIRHQQDIAQDTENPVHQLPPGP